MRINYTPNELRLRMKYICTCGHKMYRINSDYYTMSPFNRHTETASQANRNYKVFTRNRECPKCKARIRPVLEDWQEKQCAVWKAIYDADCERIKRAAEAVED